MTLRLPKELHRRLRRVAFELDTTMNAIIAEAAERHVTELEAQLREGAEQAREASGQ